MAGVQIVPLEASKTEIDGLWIIRMKQVTDERGTVREFYRESAFREAGLPSLGPRVTHGKTVTVSLTKGTQVLVPAGVCNGFQAVSAGGTQYLYCFDAEWVPGMAGVAVNPLDPELAIPWPIPVDPGDAAQLSAKDAALPRLRELG